MRNFIQRLVRVSGVELRRVRGRGTLGGALEHLKARGFSPTHIIDGGASDGRWSRIAQSYFPNAHYILVEPLEEYTEVLHTILHAEVIPAVLAEAQGSAYLNINGPFNSSLSRESAEKRQVQAIALDSILREPSQTLLKLDLEEAELPVLKGSILLSQVGAVILECTFINLPTYCAYMEERGFRVTEIFDAGYRRENGDMFQVDILFLPK